jgi:hypothetical protein
VSADGRKLAFTCALNGRMMLWVRAMDSLQARPFAGTDNAAYPFWSPDSLSIGFFVPNKLKVVEVSGGPARDITDVVVGRGGAWSPEGVILFCPRPIGVLNQISAAGGTATPVTSLDESRAPKSHIHSHSFCPAAASFCISPRVPVRASPPFALVRSIQPTRKCS